MKSFRVRVYAEVAFALMAIARANPSAGQAGNGEPRGFVDSMPAQAQLRIENDPQNIAPISDRNVPGPLSRVAIPFKLYQDYLIVVQGSLGPLDRLNFLVDTGLTPTLVDSRIAEKLGLSGTGLHQLTFFDRKMDVAQVVLPELQLGPLRTESLPGVVLDLSAFVEILGVRIDAIVGFDVLSRSTFSIDYNSKKIVFGSIEPSPLSVPFETGPPFLTVKLQVQEESIRLLVDSAAANLVLFQCHLPNRVRHLQATTRKHSFFNGAGEEVRLAEVPLPSVRLGPAEFGAQKGLEADDNVKCSLLFDGVVGIRWLGLSWVAFDFEHQMFVWKK